MRNLLKSLALAMSTVALSSAQSSEQVWKLGYSQIDASSGGIKLEADGFQITGEFSMNEEQPLYGFIRYSDLSNSDDTILGVPVDFDVQSIAIGLKYNFTGQNLEDKQEPILYGRLGFEKSSGDARVGPFTFSDSDTGLTYGVGLEHYFKDFGLFVEWASHDNDVIDEDSINFGVAFKF